LFGLNQEGGTLSLESKAKTTDEIEFDYEVAKKRVMICKYKEILDATIQRDELKNKKWVPLDYAQKLENEVIILNTAHDLRVARINQLEKQIAEVNKILEEPTLHCEGFEHCQKVKRLREVLK
jgi:hypothetical protein